MSTRRVLVTDGETRAVVGVARGLAADGFDVAVAATAPARLAPAHLSRTVGERLVVPDPLSAPDAFLDALAGAVAAGNFGVLVPGADASLLRISSGRARLEPHVRLGLPARESVERSLDKSDLAATASRHGLDPPPTVACAGSAAAVDAARDFGFPLLVKPTLSVDDRVSPPRRFASAWVGDARELERAIAGFGGTGLVQRRVEGRVASFAGVFAGGRLLGEAFSRYHRTWYPRAGNACYSETADAPAELRRRVVALLTDLAWEGLFELELIETAGGRWHAIDMNPRPYGSIALAIGAGANLPSVWCRHLLGYDPDPVTATSGVFYRWTDADLRHGWWQWREGNRSAAVRVLRPRRGVVHAFGRRSDPGPGVARLVELGGIAVSSGRASRRVPAAARSRLPTVVIGAGPNGLAVAAHLRDAGIETMSFGEPLESWSGHMPAGMLLRSRRRSSHIADPRQALTIGAYEQACRLRVSDPTITLEEFVDYGRWFQRTAVRDVDPRRVTAVARDGDAFLVQVDGGEEIATARVIVAAGLSPFMDRPEPFARLPAAVCSHSYEHADLGVFAGLRTAVIGSGQSALESAALLHEAGAAVEVLARAPAIRWLGELDGGVSTSRKAERRPLPAITPPPTDVGGRATGWIAAAPEVFRVLPESLHPTISYRCIRPAGAGWLRPRLVDVPISCGRSVLDARADVDCVKLSLSDGSTREVDRVLLGTGFKIDVRRYPFLTRELMADIRLADGFPVLGPGLESSVPGLHFAGAPAAYSFGPVMRFVVGSWYAAPAIARRAADRRQPPVSFAFPRRLGSHGPA
jgi:cation diffusion facilitator CzcD-associated flavoprotein CzcO/predicted ATP-grasp superfamily ATP-dependent carboligase